MSGWNYRLVYRKDPQGDYVALHAVFYDDDGKPNGRTDEPATFIASLEEEGLAYAIRDLLRSLERAAVDAARFPVLTDEELGGLDD